MRYIDNIAYGRYRVGAMDYAIHFADLLRPHLKALRKKRGLTQAQLGAKLGVGQVRIAEIEGSPSAVAVDQLIRLLSALDATLVIRDTLPDAAGNEPGKVPGTTPSSAKRPPRAGKPVAPKDKWSSKRMSGGSTLLSPKDGRVTSKGDLEKIRSSNPGATVSPTSARNVLIRPKKGSW